MKFTFFNHQNKGIKLVEALLDGGHELVPFGQPADVLLIDGDFPVADRRAMIDYYHAQNALILVYPHSALPPLFWDTPNWTPYDKVDGYLVFNQAHEDFMRAYGFDRPVHHTGWYMTPIKPFKPTVPKNILFAPIHPDGAGWLYADGIAGNQMIHEQLKMWAKNVNGQVKVRYIGKLPMNGLTPADGIAYSRGHMDTTYSDIEWADVVIGVGTFAMMSLALGKPTVFFNLYEETLYNESLPVIHIEELRPLIDYCHVANAHNLTAKILEAALVEDTNFKRYIGEAFKPDEFCQLVERLEGAKHGG